MLGYAVLVFLAFWKNFWSLRVWNIVHSQRRDSDSLRGAAPTVGFTPLYIPGIFRLVVTNFAFHSGFVVYYRPRNTSLPRFL